MRGLTKDGRETPAPIGVGLSSAMTGMAILCVVFASIRMLLQDDKRGFSATLLVGIATCFATAIVAVRRDRERLRMTTWLAVGYASILAIFSLFFALWAWR